MYVVPKLSSSSRNKKLLLWRKLYQPDHPTVFSFVNSHLDLTTSKIIPHAYSTAYIPVKMNKNTKKTKERERNKHLLCYFFLSQCTTYLHVITIIIMVNICFWITVYHFNLPLATYSSSHPYSPSFDFVVSFSAADDYVHVLLLHPFFETHILFLPYHLPT